MTSAKCHQKLLTETKIKIQLVCFVQGSGSLPDEPLHIKEALSRLVVEITKREWPQKWGSLLPDLNSICALGVSQVYFQCALFFLQRPCGHVVIAFRTVFSSSVVLVSLTLLTKLFTISCDDDIMCICIPSISCIASRRFTILIE